MRHGGLHDVSGEGVVLVRGGERGWGLEKKEILEGGCAVEGRKGRQREGPDSVEGETIDTK